MSEPDVDQGDVVVAETAGVGPTQGTVSDDAGVQVFIQNVLG